MDNKKFGEKTVVLKEEVKVGAMHAWSLKKIQKIKKLWEMKKETTSLIAKNAVKMWE